LFLTQDALSFGGGKFNLKPALKLGLFAPDLAHGGQGVTLDQGPARGNGRSNLSVNAGVRPRR
jgi:hypothetical protein